MRRFLRSFRTLLPNPPDRHLRRLRGQATIVALLATGAGLGLVVSAGYLITATAWVGAGLGGTVAYSLFSGSAPVRLLAMGRPVLRYADRLLTHRLTLRTVAGLKESLFRQLARQPVDSLHVRRNGLSWHLLNGDIEQVGSTHAQVIQPLLTTGLLGLAMVVGLALYVPALAGWVGAVLFVGAGGLVLSPLVLRPATRTLIRQQQWLRSRWLDYSQGYRDLRLTGQLADQRKRIEDALRELGRQRDHLAVRSALLTVGLNGLLNGLLLGAVYVLLSQYGNTSAESGPLRVGVLLLLLAFFEGLPGWSAISRHWLGRAEASRRIRVELSRPSTPAASVADDARDATGLETACQLRAVSVHYPGQMPLFSELDLSIPVGSRVVLTGPNGAGKTTLLYLLAGLMPPTGGHVYIGGTSLSTRPTHWLRQQVGMLEQRPVLFDTTLATNLRLARPDATDAELEWALDKARLLDFVRQLPQGLHTPVREAGMAVSGGEARRLCLARLFLRNTRLVLLDEPTAELDPATARGIWTSIEQEWADKTLIVVSHRPVPTDFWTSHYRLEAGQLMAQ